MEPGVAATPAIVRPPLWEGVAPGRGVAPGCPGAGVRRGVAMGFGVAGTCATARGDQPSVPEEA